MIADVVSDAVDLATENDREWFAANPERSYRVRLLVAGEIACPRVAGDGLWYVAVRQIRPGVRVRAAGYLYAPPHDEELDAEALFYHLRGGE